MKKSNMILLLLLAMAGSLAFCQTGASGSINAQVQDKERLLLQSLTPDQLQLIGQNAALFERMPDPGADPNGALQGLLAAPGIRGMRRDEAAFAIMALAGRHLEEDLKEIMGGIVALKESRLVLQKALTEINASLGGSRKQQESAAGSGKGGHRESADREATAFKSGPAGSGLSMAFQPARTLRFGIEYWRASLAGVKDCRRMSLQERLAEAGVLNARLAELDGLLGRMTDQLERGRLRREQFAQTLEGLVQKLPSKFEQQ